MPLQRQATESVVNIAALQTLLLVASFSPRMPSKGIRAPMLAKVVEVLD
jgi:hypothetical protein